jgi:hypothetical protein
MEQEPGSAEPTTTHDELMRPAPRNVHMTGTGWINVVLVIVIFGLAAALLLYLGNAVLEVSAKRNTLRTGASETAGRITREWTSGRNSTQHIGYVFQIDKTIYSGESTVPDNIWNSLKQAGGVTIKYSLADPRINHPADWEDSTVGMWFSLVIPVIFSFAGQFLARELLTQRRLVAVGLPALARVTERVKGGRGGAILKYEFRIESGEIVQGACSEEKRREAGSTIFVIYLPYNPRTSRVYPFETFEVDE